VLKRDGTNVVTGTNCAATSGTWKSPFDGATWTAASDVDIDHMVPLSNAWKVRIITILLWHYSHPAHADLLSLKSGAASWTTAKREDFANDLATPQLWAVTDDVNQAKGDKSPDQWKPPLASFHCTYSRAWIAVKSAWALTITSAEKTALNSMLDTC
jgi:hypothetical protein